MQVWWESPFVPDPYEQVVLPGDGLKEEEPVEPYQKIGPSKTDALQMYSSCSLNDICVSLYSGNKQEI